EIGVHEDWVGKNLIELGLRSTYGINVIGMKRDGVFNINPDPEEALGQEDILVVIGKNDVLSKLNVHE
ncbi:MAG: cation:proton antiporter regulatory subunit, partial [Acetivibrio ethanolgignens]